MTERTSDERSMSGVLKSMTRTRVIEPQVLGLAIVLSIVVILLGFTTSGMFFLPNNLLNIGLAIAVIGLMAFAETIVIIAGGIDISVGSTAGLCSILSALAMTKIPMSDPSNGLIVGLLVSLLTGAVAGLVNGLIVTQGKINPVIATLATFSAYRGLAYALSEGSPIGVRHASFNFLGVGKFVEIPMPILILIGVGILFYIFLNYSKVARRIFAIGGNPRAARLAGINSKKYLLGAFVLSGLTAGLAAVILTARAKTGLPSAGANGLELQAITAAILGGAAMTGGEGSIIGTILAVLIVGVLNNGMILLGVEQFYQMLASGLLLVIAMLVQGWQIRRVESSREAGSASEAAEPGIGRRKAGSVDPQIIGLLVALLVVIVIFGVQVPGQFFNLANIKSVVTSIPLLGLVAFSAFLVIMSGGLDVSVGATVGLCSVAAAVAMQSLPWSDPILGAIIGVGVGLGTGFLAGMFNGLLITYGHMPSVIATLATLSAYRGLAFVLTENGYAISITNPAFNQIGSGTIFGIPYLVFILLITLILMAFVFNNTNIGRNVLAMGGNPTAARLAGINLRRYRLGIYSIAGTLAGLAGVILSARTTSGQPISGSDGLEMEAITAAVLGGTALAGGKGNVIGVILGVLIIGTLTNGMILLNVPTFYQFVAKGVLLIFAVFVQGFRWQRRAKA